MKVANGNDKLGKGCFIRGFCPETDAFDAAQALPVLTQGGNNRPGKRIVKAVALFLQVVGFKAPVTLNLLLLPFVGRCHRRKVPDLDRAVVIRMP